MTPMPTPAQNTAHALEQPAGELDWLPSLCDLFWWGCGGSWEASPSGECPDAVAAWAGAEAGNEMERVKGTSSSTQPVD